MSRLDWGSPGFRQGLVELAFQHFEKENVRFVILAGGLVSYPHLKRQTGSNETLLFVWEEEFGGDYGEDDKKPSRKVKLEQARQILFERWAKEIAEMLPKLRNGSGHLVRIYIVTSPAPNYDGWIGREIARRLTVLRPDIRYWGEESVQLPLKYQNKIVWVLGPEKASWRSKYFSTAVDRLIEDEEKQTSQALPDLWIVGCTASSLQRPKGEKKRPYISVPALHRLKEVHTAENQVGILVVEFSPQGHFLVRNYNFKDYTARERECIPDPEGTPIQKGVVTELKRKGAMTIGMLEDALQMSRAEITAAIEALNGGSYAPAIRLDKDSQLYDFDSRWVETKLKYPMVTRDMCREDTLLNFGCLHAGSVFSEYRFFVHEVPKIMIRQGSKVLVGCGDLIEGLEHDLDKRGETMAGMNYTDMERLAAWMVCQVMLKTFKTRFAEALQAFKEKAPSRKQLRSLVEESLVTFLYREGNHDAWVLKRGIVPLAVFGPALISCLTKGVAEILKERGFKLPDLQSITEAKVCYGEVHKLPSGMGITLLHPFMARALTSSLRAQQMLDQAKTPVVVGANFHVAINVGQWDSSNFGQRVAQQVGSIVWKTEFEHGRLKTLDVGVGHLRIFSREGRILITESAFFSEGTSQETHKNEELLLRFMESLENGS
uniref:Uncharacterized protein n=1 Tax=candidate division WWE3 bacterium TaxID=2053526 RepID=A0A831YZ57_UNCKA